MSIDAGDRPCGTVRSPTRQGTASAIRSGAKGDSSNLQVTSSGKAQQETEGKAGVHPGEQGVVAEVPEMRDAALRRRQIAHRGIELIGQTPGQQRRTTARGRNRSGA